MTEVMTNQSSPVPRVAVTAAGSGPGVAIIKALGRQSSLPLEVIALDIDPTASGLRLADRFAILPPCDSPGFLDTLIHFSKHESLDFLIPILDRETPFYARHREELRDRCGLTVLVNPESVIETANNKLKSHRVCLERGLSAPTLHSPGNSRINSLSEIPLPWIRKPISGIGSRGIVIARDARACASVIPADEDSLIQEFIEGTEFSIDLLADEGRLQVAVPRERVQVKDGQTVKGRTRLDPTLIRFASQVAEAFGLSGVGCLQCIVRHGITYFIELNPRYGTGVSLSIGAGVNFPILQIKLAQGLEIDPTELQAQDDLWMTRYWEEILIPGSQLPLSS